MRNICKYFSLNKEKKLYLISGIFSIVIAISLITYHFAAFRLPLEGYMSISLLDSEEKAIDYPEKIFLNEDEKFDIYINVENQKEKTHLLQVRMIVTENHGLVPPLNLEPTKVFEEPLTSGKRWVNQVSISTVETGAFKIFFELWSFNQKMEAFEFTDKFCMIKLQVF